MSVRDKRLMACALVFALFLGCISGLSGCGENEKKHFVLRSFSTLGAEEDAAAYSAVIAEYSKSHKHVTINDTSTTKAGSYKMELSLASTYRGANTPDVIYYSSIEDMSGLCDFFVTVDEIRRDYPKFAANISEAAINSVAASDGRRYCIPVRGEWRGIVINAAMFRRSSLKIPEKWDDIIRAAHHFENNKKVSLFANSLDESSSLIEYMVRSLGGMKSIQSAINGNPDDNWDTVLDAIEALDNLNAFPKMPKSSFDSLVSPTELSHTAKKAQPSAVELYNSEKAAILLLDNTVCGEIDTDIDSNYIALPEVGTISENEYEYTTSQSNTYPTHALSGPVYPPITANTLPTDPPTTTTVKHSPDPAESTRPADGDADTGQEEHSSDNGLYVNFDEGFYITKKAYYDKVKREDIIEFVEFFLKEENATRLCCHYQAPSLSTLSDKARDKLTGKSNIFNGVINSVEKADKFVVTTQTQENVFFWEHCSLAVACMSKGILTKKEALGMISDTQRTVSDIYSSRR
ncbi:MAG: extracellular solute-binding protein [Clostridia bacterium]|nr:extracellular solute-binding protein [Clostridia bacterium]